MTAPAVWIGIPLALAALLFILPRERLISYLGTLFALGLAAIAYWVPPGTAQRIGSLSLRIEPSLSLFGRQLSLNSGDQTLLILVYGMAAFWFFGTLAAGWARQVVSLGLVVIALLVASLSVRPFLYAALFVEMAVLVSIPLLAPPASRPGRGLLRFLIYQTFAMPFILFAGFLLSGVEAGPADVAQVIQAGILLLMGFAFLLAVFPLNTWIPLLAEETSPYAVGFLMTMLTTFGLVLALNFIDRFSWLRDSAQLPSILQTAGLLTFVTAGIWAVFQRHLGRIVAYAIIAETGVSLLAMSLPDRQVGLQILFYLFIPRALALGVWTMSISILQSRAADLRFAALQGAARHYPVASAGVVFANLALVGTPLLAAFPVRQALWENLAVQSLPLALWFGLASLGLWVVALRSLAVLTMFSGKAEWVSRETWPQRILLGIGLFGLFLSGIFPQWAQPLLANLPAMFDYLGK
jgi:formate hydrogenlyase subunit 3/multisubunit Na+/H+ antiporter MnhD subunit